MGQFIQTFGAYSAQICGFYQIFRTKICGFYQEVASLCASQPQL